MTRSREFDKQYILDQAVNVFWQLGYEKTSLNDLRKKMEISNQTLYNVFGDKYGLFLAVFDRYNEIGRINREKLLLRPESDLSSIKKYVDYLLILYTEDPGFGGCLLCNSITEFGVSDPVMHQKIVLENRDIKNAYIYALKNAIKLGQLGNKVNPKVFANLISTVMNGISNMSKSGVKRKELQRQVNLLFESITTYGT